MPSGSKRRKAAKKKKEKEAPVGESSSIHTNDSNSNGDDEVRSHDEKYSDGGEPDSLASHDHHGPFNGGSEELGKSDSLPVALADVEYKPVNIPVDSDAVQKIVAEGSGEVEIVKEVKFEDDSPIPIECVEPLKEQSEMDNEKSNIIRSDGESLVTEEEKFGVEDRSDNLNMTQFEDLETLGESLPQELTKVIDDAPGEDVNVAEHVVSLSEKVIDLTEAAPSENQADFELNFRGNEDLLTLIDEVQQVASNGLECASKNVGAKVIPLSVDDFGVESPAVEVQQVASNGLESASKIVGLKVLPLSVDNFGVESLAVTSPLKEKEGELLSSSGVSVAQTHNGAEKAKDLEVCELNNGLESSSKNVRAKVLPVSVENSGVESGAVTSVLKEREGELFPSTGVLVTQAHNGTEKAKDFKVCESNNGLESASNNVRAIVFPMSIENSGVESLAVTSVSKEKDSELSPSSGVSIAQTHNDAEKAKDLVVCESKSGLESASSNVGPKVFPTSVENSGVESGAVTLVSKEKEGELLPSSLVSVAQTCNGTEKAKDFEVCESNDGLESASKNAGAIEFHVSVENSGVESGAITSVSKEKEGELLPSSGNLVAQTHNGTQKAKGFEDCESSEDQPLVAPAPRIAEKMSWMSCCGLFDVFMGSR